MFNCINLFYIIFLNFNILFFFVKKDQNEFGKDEISRKSE